MAVTINTGQVNEDAINADERVRDVSDKIAQLEARTTQFTTMLMKTRSKVATNSKVEWLNPSGPLLGDWQLQTPLYA